MVVYSAIHNIHVKCFLCSLSPCVVARRLLLVGWVWVGCEGVSSCCRAVSGTFFRISVEKHSRAKTKCGESHDLPGRITSAEQTSIILKVAGTLNQMFHSVFSNIFKTKKFFFFFNSIFNSFPGRCNTLSFFYL